MKIEQEKELSLGLNLLDLLGISLVLIVAFVYQFALHELPCPLCLLQRLGLFGIAFGVVLNLRFGTRVSHYAISCLSAIFMGAVAVRQILLHIDPNSGDGFGSAVFGLHMYTWSFLIAVVFIVVTLLCMLLEKQFTKFKMQIPKFEKHLITFAIALFLILIVANVVMVF